MEVSNLSISYNDENVIGVFLLADLDSLLNERNKVGRATHRHSRSYGVVHLENLWSRLKFR